MSFGIDALIHLKSHLIDPSVTEGSAQECTRSAIEEACLKCDVNLSCLRQAVFKYWSSYRSCSSSCFPHGRLFALDSLAPAPTLPLDCTFVQFHASPIPRNVFYETLF